MSLLFEYAPAKINLSLRILGKRAYDDYHDLTSIVAFAYAGDEISLKPGYMHSLSVDGPFASQSGSSDSNLVLRATKELDARVENLVAGHFELTKNLPVGAGLGGGSSDAAAALRLLAKANEIALDDPRLFQAAIATGADVLVCLSPNARLMHGIGDVLSRPLNLPKLFAVIVFPNKPLPTSKVFAAFSTSHISDRRRVPFVPEQIPSSFAALVEFLRYEPNDLETAAQYLAPIICEVRTALAWKNARLIRMSGSGSAVFGIYENEDEANAVAVAIHEARPDWWVQAMMLV